MIVLRTTEMETTINKACKVNRERKMEKDMHYFTQSIFVSMKLATNGAWEVFGQEEKPAIMETGRFKRRMFQEEWPERKRKWYKMTNNRKEEGRRERAIDQKFWMISNQPVPFNPKFSSSNWKTNTITDGRSLKPVIGAERLLWSLRFIIWLLVPGHRS